MEAKFRVLLPQAKEHRQPPEAGGNEEGVSSGVFGRCMCGPANILTLDFWSPEVRE